MHLRFVFCPLAFLALLKAGPEMMIPADVGKMEKWEMSGEKSKDEKRWTENSSQT